MKTAAEKAKIKKAYQEQLAAIEILAKRLLEDCARFANSEHDSPWFGELGHVKGELTELTNWTKNFK